VSRGRPWYVLGVEFETRHVSVARAFAAVFDICPELVEMIEPEPSWEPGPPPLDKKVSYEEIRPLLAEPPDNAEASWFRLRRWAAQAPDAEREKAAADLLSRPDTETRQILKGLRLFLRPDRGFPGPIERIVEWALHTPDGDLGAAKDMIAHAAGSVLSNCRRPDVRSLALEWMESGHRLGVAAGCLSKNFEEGDWARLIAMLDVAADDELHGVGMAIRDAADDAGHEAIPALLGLYEQGFCGFCRETTVTRLDELHAVPEWMVAECVHDARYETAEWAEARIKATDTASGSSTPPPADR